MPFGLGWSEVVLILAIGLLLFGNKLPSLARSLGQAVVAFRRSVTEIHEEIAEAAK